MQCIFVSRFVYKWSKYHLETNLMAQSSAIVHPVSTCTQYGRTVAIKISKWYRYHPVLTVPYHRTCTGTVSSPALFSTVARYLSIQPETLHICFLDVLCLGTQAVRLIFAAVIVMVLCTLPYYLFMYLHLSNALFWALIGYCLLLCGLSIYKALTFSSC